MIVHELGWKDEYVAYTDCDVMFTASFSETLAAQRPRYLSVAPEFKIDDWENMNSGVMVMNVEALREDWSNFQATVLAQIAHSDWTSFDQRAYRAHYRDRWERLPPELNWKPYWGQEARAEIIHFHGPKPFQKYTLASGRAPEKLRALATAGFYHYAAIYDQLLVESANSRPPPLERVEVFGGIDPIEGLLASEGPYEAEFLPRVRWGLAPRVRVRLKPPTDLARPFLHLGMMSLVDGQEAVVRLNGAEILRHRFQQTACFDECRVSLPRVLPDDVIEITADKWLPGADNLKRALLFKHLRVG